MLPTLLIRKLEAFGPVRGRIARMSSEVLRRLETVGETRCRTIAGTIVGPDRSKRMLRMMQLTACVVAPTSENRYA